MLKYKYVLQTKHTKAIYCIEQHSETVMVRNYQNADCSLKNKFTALFIIISGTLSFPIATLPARAARQLPQRRTWVGSTHGLGQPMGWVNPRVGSTHGWVGWVRLWPTELSGKVRQSVVSVCPFVFTPVSEPADFWPSSLHEYESWPWLVGNRKWRL